MDGTENGSSFLYWINQQLLLSIQNMGKLLQDFPELFSISLNKKKKEKKKNHNDKLSCKDLRVYFPDEIQVFLFTNVRKFIPVEIHFRTRFHTVTCIGDDSR